MAPSLHAKVAIDALCMAIEQRRPAAGLIHHSDRGSQYASASFQQMLKNRNITCSMSRRGNCWDNAMMESFFATLKKERIHQEQYATRAQARASVFDYIECFYNRVRRHSALGYLSPEQFEQAA